RGGGEALPVMLCDARVPTLGRFGQRQLGDRPVDLLHGRRALVDGILDQPGQGPLLGHGAPSYALSAGSVPCRLAGLDAPTLPPPQRLRMEARRRCAGATRWGPRPEIPLHGKRSLGRFARPGRPRRVTTPTGAPHSTNAHAVPGTSRSAPRGDAA